MFIVLFALWLLLNGRVTPEIVLTGLALSGLIYLFMVRFLDASPGHDLQLFKRLAGFLAYIVWLLREIFRSAFAVASRIWHFRTEPKPAVKSFSSPLTTQLGKITLANSITLTPGTVTVDLHKDRYIVHCLDEPMGADLENSGMQSHILKVERGKKA